MEMNYLKEKQKDVDRADRFLCRSSAVPAGGRGRIVSGDGVLSA